MNIVPPYINKFVNQKEREWHKAQEKRIKAEKDLEFAKEYENVCKERYEEAKKNTEN